MAQPPAYTPVHSFIGDSATNPAFPGQALDVEFNDVKTTTDAIRANLKLIQRDDGAIANGSITYDQLSASLQAAGLQPAVAWTTATAYAIGANVLQSGSLYRCLVAHTAGTFATDLTALKWVLVGALAVGPQGVQGPTGAGTQGIQGNTGATGLGYGGTSATSLLIANSVTKLFTLDQATTAYQVGNYVRATSSASGANFMEGTVSAYAGTSLSIAVTTIGGSGTHADWTFATAGVPGSSGVSSLAGNTGAWTLGNGLTNVTNELDIDPSFLGPACFGGRLTLQSATPVMNTDQLAAQTLYYAPFKSKSVPTYTSGKWALKQFTANATDQVGLSLALSGSASWAADSLHDVFAVMDSGTLKIATRAWDAGMLPTTAQITNVTTITTGTGAAAWTRSTAAFNGTPVQNGAASATIAAAVNSGMTNFLGQNWGAPQTVTSVVVTAPTDHYIFSNVGPMDLQLFGSNDGTNWQLLGVHWINDAAIGAAYTLTVNADNQIPYSYHRIGFDGLNGTNTLFVAQVQFFKTVAPANGRRLTLHDGIWVNDASITARTGAASTIATAQYEGVFLGVVHIDTLTAGQISFASTYQAGATCGIWNLENQRKLVLKGGARSTLKSYTLTSQVFTPCGGASPFTVQVLSGMALDPVALRLIRAVPINASTNAGGYEAGIGVDQVSGNNCYSFSGLEASCNLDFTGQLVGFEPSAYLTMTPHAGVHTYTPIERVNNGGGTVTVMNEARETVLQVEFVY